MKIKKAHVILVAVLVAVALLFSFKLKANKEELQNEIAVTQQKVKEIAVSVSKVSSDKIEEEVKATGVLVSENTLRVISETQGQIEKIYKRKGDYVNKGDVIAKVDDEAIAASVLTAEANYEQFQRDVERFSNLAKENVVTKRDLEQTKIGLKKAKADLINARKALDNTSVKAPISGYINSDFITTGQFLGGGSPVCEIVNNSTLKLNIKITEKEIYKVALDQQVAINISAFPTKEFTGTITAIAEKADAGMKFDVEITLNNDDKLLKSGLYAEAVLPVQRENNLIISKAAIIGSMSKPEVFVAQNGIAKKRSIILGDKNTTQAEVLKGLAAGEQVIISGQLNLKDGDPVKIVQ